MEQSFTSPYNPCGNAFCKWFNLTLFGLLKTLKVEEKVLVFTRFGFCLQCNSSCFYQLSAVSTYIWSPPKKRKHKSKLDQKINAAIEENWKLSERLSVFDPKTITDTVINAVQGNIQSSKPKIFSQKQFRPSQFYVKPRELQLVPGTDGSLKPDEDCNYCKDLGHLKFNCPKLKEKEARLVGQQNYQKLKKEN